MARIDFLGTPLDVLTMPETIALAEQAMRNKTCVQHVVVNVAKFVNMRTDENLRRDVVESDIINIDGMGVVLACRMLGFGNVQRVAGIDIMEELLKLCAEKGYRPYILGAKQDILERAVANIKARYPGIRIAGYRNGYFKREDEPGIVEAIRTSGADCLFVAISSPTKERFTRQYRGALGVSFIMGVGGSIDVMSGMTRRAPLWMQNYGLEWLYRVLQEPRRLWKRYMTTNLKFLFLVTPAILRRAVSR